VRPFDRARNLKTGARPEFARRHPIFPREDGGEVTVGKPNGTRDLPYRQPFIVQQRPRMQQPLIGQKLMRGFDGRLFEGLGKMEEAHAGGLGDILQRHFDLRFEAT